LWSMPNATREAIGQALEAKFTFLIEKLGAAGTRALAEKHAPFVPGSYPAFAAVVGAAQGPEDVSGLAD
jgi:hypothetical protein